MTLPIFNKLGVKLNAPSWLSTMGAQISYPRIFHNDAHRANVPGLPAAAYSCLFGTDHSSGTAYIGRADFSTIEGTWTDSGAYIHSGDDQREAAIPLFDPINNRVNVYVHDDVSTVTNGTQAARLLTTSDLETLTDQGEIMDYGYHTGYGKYEYSDGLFRAIHGQLAVMSGVWVLGSSTSADGETFIETGNYFHMLAKHIAPEGYRFGNPSCWFTWEDQRYILCGLQNITSGLYEQIVAIPVAADRMSPIGGYVTLLTPTPGGSDHTIRIVGEMLNIGGTLYLLYTGIDTGNTQRVMLAKAGVGAAAQSTPKWNLTSTGDLESHTLETEPIDWDATAETLPASLQVELGSGSNLSSWSSGNYYEMKGGTSSLETLVLTSGDDFDPTTTEAIEWELRGVTMRGSDVAAVNVAIRVGFFDGLSSSQDLLLVHMADSGRYIEWRNGSQARSEVNQGIWGYGVAGSIAIYSRAVPTDWKLRLHDYGRRITLWADGTVAWHRELLSQFDVPTKPYLQLIGISGWQPWVRFTGFSLRTFTIAPPTSLTANTASGRVALTWTDPSGNGITSIKVYRGTTSGSLSLLDTVAAGLERYTDEAVTDGVTYHYAIAAVDGEGEESTQTTEASIVVGSGGVGWRSLARSLALQAGYEVTP